VVKTYDRILIDASCKHYISNFRTTSDRGWGLVASMVVIVFGLIAFSIGLLMIIVELKDNSGEPDRVKTRSIAGIILSIIS